MDDIVSSDEEWEESDYGNPSNTTTNSFFKPYIKAREKNDIEKEDERSQKKHKSNKSNLEINNRHPNKRECKAEKFEAIKYSLGPNEEYISIKRCEYNAWERNEDNINMAYPLRTIRRIECLDIVLSIRRIHAHDRRIWQTDPY
ncbi:hypothetical protein Tco_0987452 [Tanacetum coccineum]